MLTSVMIELVSIFLMFLTSLCTTQGGLLNFSTDIMDCDVILTWTGAPMNSFDVWITKYQKPREYLYTNNTQFKVHNGLFYKSIKIEVRVYLKVRSQEPYNDSTFTYEVEPMKPKISVNFGVMVDSYANLTCSLPECYTRRDDISYSWFVNDTVMVDKIGQTLRLPVTKDEKYNKYSCKAKGNPESDRSDRVQINPLTQPRSESNTPFLKKEIIFLVAVIASVILVTTVATAMILYFLKRKKKKSSLENVQVDAIEVENEHHPEHPTSELYATVDKTLVKKRNDTVDVLSEKKDTHVQNEEGCLTTTATANKKHDVKEKVEESENPSAETCESSASSHVKQEGLIYIDVEFVNKTENPDTDTPPQIHGDEERTEYTFVDFSKSAQPEHDKPETEGKITEEANCPEVLET